MKTLRRAGMLAGACAACLLADFSYQETSKITGGLMAGMMKVAGVFSQKAREPIQSTILVKGNRMASFTGSTGHIVDLEKETFTEIDFGKKTYSVTSFAELAQFFKEVEARMATERGEQSDITVKASVRQTGQSKTFSGLEARQVIVTIEMEGTDKQTGQRGVFMTAAGDMWIADVPGYQEVSSFYQRMAQKLPWTPGTGAAAMQRAEISKGMAELYKEAAKLNGLTVYQTIKMGLPSESGAGSPQPEARPPAQQPEEPPSVGGALGRLGGLGRLGRLGRKKEPEQPRTAEPAPASGDTAGVLIEMTSEAGGFSTAPVDPARFAIPPGFKLVETDLRRALQRR